MTRPLFRLPLSKVHRERRGQAAFEFLLTLPFLVLFILLAVDMGILMYEYVSVNNAAREGARYAAVNCQTGTCTASEIQQRTVDRSGGILTSTGDVTVDYRNVNGNNADGATGRGDSVVVKVNHTYNMLFFPKSIPVVACSDFRLEAQDKGTGLPTGSGC